MDEPLVPLPDRGRVFRGGRRVRLADADPSGRLRLDACARYLQDLGNDDTADSGIDDDAVTWVVRRVVVDVHTPPRWREWLDLATWCGGLGGRWAERRMSMVGDGGGHIEVSTLWVQVDVATMAPCRLTQRFLDVYGEAAGRPEGVEPAVARRPARRRGGGTVGTPGRSTSTSSATSTTRPTGRRSRSRSSPAPPSPTDCWANPHRAVMEYGPGIPAGARFELLVDETDDHLSVWFTVDDVVQAAATVVPLPAAARSRGRRVGGVAAERGAAGSRRPPPLAAGWSIDTISLPNGSSAQRYQLEVR